MASPTPSDPYVALGVARDADLPTIRKAYHKLVLKFHPDRIKDEAERERGRDEFEKVQQAYELLSDSARRSRHDDKVKLAELKREAMARDPPPTRYTSYPPRPQPTPRQFRDGRMYEERVPGAYFDEEDRFQEEPIRASSRKHETYERKPTASQSEKERKSAKSQPNPGLGFDFTAKMTSKLHKTAANARDRVKEREAHSVHAKARDRDRRRDSADKLYSRQPYDDDDSDSDSDTATNFSRPQTRSPRPSYPNSPRARAHTDPVHKKESRPSKLDVDVEDEWERRHKGAKDYIERASKPRPNMPRTDSAHQYWENSEERGSGRRSGSDSDRRQKSARSGREPLDNPKVRPPPPHLPTHNSAPDVLRNYVDRDAPVHHRSASGLPREPPRESRREFTRNQTVPAVPTTRRHDSVPTRGSKLRNAETHGPHDSGYGSTSPNTPEMHGTSPPKHSSKWDIVDEERNYRQPYVNDEDDYHRNFSPPPRERERDREQRERERERERDRRGRTQRPPISSDNSRSRSSRTTPFSTPTVELPPRPAPMRHESARSAQPRGRDSSPISREPINRENVGPRPKQALYGEVPSEDRERTRYYSYPKMAESPRVGPQDVNYGQYGHGRRSSTDDREYDYFPGSHHREQLRQPLGDRRGSVY